jgi:hypothetical protein
MPYPASRSREILADELTVAEEKAGLEIAQLPTQPASPIGDQPMQPTLI